MHDLYSSDLSGNEGPTLDEYILALQALKAEVGGAANVQKWLPTRGRHGAQMPVVAYKRVYPSMRGSNHSAPQFFHPEHDNPVQKGQLVIRV